MYVFHAALLGHCRRRRLGKNDRRDMKFFGPDRAGAMRGMREFPTILTVICHYVLLSVT